MFISSENLGMQYGINDKIARFYIDREPPANNLYWKDKLLYLRPDVGYIFIPLIADLLYKAGINRDDLLSEDYVCMMEDVGHVAALEEAKKINHSEAIRQCISIGEKGKNKEWQKQMVAYFTGEDHPFQKLRAPFSALHRGDYFLFSLSALDFDEPMHKRVLNIWFSLITTLLLLDDAEDIEIDKAAGEENAFLQSGMTAYGIETLKQLVKINLQKIDTLNKVMANRIDSKYIYLLEQPHIQKMINV